MSSTEIVLKFLAFLADVRAMFRPAHIVAEKHSGLHNVSTGVFPATGSPDYADGGAFISMALNADLIEPIDSEKLAIGISLLLRHANGVWIAEAEMGWIERFVGWAPFDSREEQATSVEEIMSLVPSLVGWLDIKFREELDKLRGGA